MRVKTVTSANGSISYSIIKDITRPDGKRSTKIVENLGNDTYLKEKYPHLDPMAYAKKRAQELKDEEDKGKITFVKRYDSAQPLPLEQLNGSNIGYLFLDKIFYDLKLDRLCQRISKETNVTFDLIQIMKTLISTRILFPSSKRSSLKLSQDYLIPPKIELQHIYRGLDLLAEHSDTIQAFAYKQSDAIIERDTSVLYYDCTNFYFEIEEEDDLRKYGKSKEHRPNPIVQMGMFMDGSGIPLAFSIFPGNENEQPSLKPIEKRVMKDFDVRDVIVCTDAGLSSLANRRFNNTTHRKYITTQSLKKFRQPLREWALSPSGWKIAGLKPGNKHYNKTYHLDDIDLDDLSITYYKERWEPRELTKEEKQMNCTSLEERYVVTFSPKYKAYQASIRERQINRALTKLNQKDPLKNRNLNSPDRFIHRVAVTENGEKAKDHYRLNEDVIAQEAKYDGYYCIATNLETSIEEIVRLNQQRWEIEENFRILKTDFKSRPVYLSRANRIQAHFLICFLSLLIYRILEKRMGGNYTIGDITKTLKQMSMTKLTEDYYIPHYTRTLLTDAIHEASGFRTDYELLDKKEFKKIEKKIKSGK